MHGLQILGNLQRIADQGVAGNGIFNKCKAGVDDGVMVGNGNNKAEQSIVDIKS